MSDRAIELVWPGKPTLEAPFEDDAVALEILERHRPANAPQGELPLDGPEAPSEPNLLVRGDNALAMRALAERYAGAIDLIYIDPPFATGLNYYSQTGVGRGERAIERRAYRDNPLGGMAGYLEAMYRRLSAMHGLLAEEGTLFLHCDWRANSMLRLLLDEIFGPACFRNEIVWRRAPNLGRQAASKQLGRVIDTIFVYSKTPGSAFPGPVPRRRAEVALDKKGKPKGARWDEARELYFTTAPRGDYTDQSIAELRNRGRVYESESGTVYIKYFLTPGQGGRWYKEQPADALWDDFAVRPLRHRPKAEDMRYDTQKPEGLLERIIAWASKPGDLVADFYAGSGTTVAVAAAMKRRWIASDVGAASIETIRRRLIDLSSRRSIAPFDIATVEPAERHRFRETRGDEAQTVLAAFGASHTEGRWGQHEGAHVYVAPDALGADALEALCRELSPRASGNAREEAGERLILLAFTWGEEPASLRRAAAQAGVTLEQRCIPMEVVRASSSRRCEISFTLRPELSFELRPHDGACHLSIRLTNLASERGADLPWHELIDTWMVAWSDAAPFCPAWRSHRSHQSRQLALETPPHHFAPGVTPVQIKVVTVFGDEIIATRRVEC